jgi:hypothetical protein
MTDREVIKQASILVTILLTDEIITEKEALTLRQALEQREQCECKRRTASVIEMERGL